MAAQTVQHGKTAQKARFGILPSGGTLRDKAAFSHGVSRSVIAVGAKLNITHKLAVGRRGRSVDPLASQSYIVDQLRRGDEGVREEQ